MTATDVFRRIIGALDAEQRQSQFNVIEFATGWKIDLIIRKSRQFSLEEFERRSVVDFAGMHVVISTAEDILIAKLEWAKLGESHRQIEDAAGILRTRSKELYQAYIKNWVHELCLAKQWVIACELAGHNP